RVAVRRGAARRIAEAGRHRRLSLASASAGAPAIGLDAELVEGALLALLLAELLLAQPARRGNLVAFDFLEGLGERFARLRHLAVDLGERLQQLAPALDEPMGVAGIGIGRFRRRAGHRLLALLFEDQPALLLAQLRRQGLEVGEMALAL